MNVRPYLEEVLNKTSNLQLKYQGFYMYKTRIGIFSIRKFVFCIIIFSLNHVTDASSRSPSVASVFDIEEGYGRSAKSRGRTPGYVLVSNIENISKTSKL